MGRPKELLIQVSRVVEVALEIIDDAGLDGLSMRELGKKLKINPSSLYHHFHNKEDILQAVREHIVRKAKVPPRLSGKRWDEQLMVLGKAFRAALCEHPNAAFLVSSTNPTRTRMTGHHLYESVIAAMLETGFTERQSVLTLATIEILASGSIIEEASLGRYMRFGDVDPVRFPSLDRATRGKPLNITSSFPEMLRIFIEGVKVVYERQKPQVASAKAGDDASTPKSNGAVGASTNNAAAKSSAVLRKPTVRKTAKGRAVAAK